jgi:hypothetical protein
VTVPHIAAFINFDAAPAAGDNFHLDDPVFGLLDTGTLAAAQTWTDVTQYLESFTFNRGVARASEPVLRYGAGTGSATFYDPDRRFDPTNLSGPYVSGGVTQVEPMRILRIGASYNATFYDLAYAFIDWELPYTGPDVQHVTVNLVDGFEVLTAERVPVDTPQGASEDSGARINRILSTVAWPVSERLVATGDSTLQATDLGGAALDEMHLVTDTEIGELHIDGLGRVVFRNRNAIFTDPRSNTSQAVFGSDRASGELPYTNVTIEYQRPTANIVRITREGGTLQEAVDAESVETYRWSTYDQTGLLMETDSEALDHANWLLGQSKDPEYRFAGIELDPEADPDQIYPHIFGRLIGDRITVKRRPSGGGAAIERDCFIRGISWTFVAPYRWKAVWQLQSARSFGQFLILDHSIVGQLDENRLAY